MKVVLLYPPDRCLPTIPYSSLAALAPVVQGLGHEVILRDLNCEVFDWLNDEGRLAGYFDFALEKVAELEALPRLDPAARTLYRTLAPVAAAPRDSILRCPEAARIMRDRGRFYQPRLFNRAFDDLQTMIRVIYSGNPCFDPENRFFVRQTMEYLDSAFGDPIVDAYRATVVDSILAGKPDLVGFTLPFFQQLNEAFKLAALLKERDPGIRIAIGGPTINDYAYRFFETPDLFRFIDFGVAGEGESALSGLLDALRDGTGFESVPNLYWQENGAVRRSAAPPDVPDLNALPTPDFRGVPFHRYLSPERVANLQTSRGCYYGKCAFCGDGFRRNFRLRAPELIYQDIRTIHEQSGVDYFLFWDSLAPPKTLKHVSRKIAENGDDIKWFAETKFEKPYTNPELVATLRRGGCRFLQFGFESASDRILSLMDKGNDLERVDTILDLLKDARIWAGVTWFIGFPTETPDEALQSYSFVADRDDRIALSVYTGKFILGRDTLAYTSPDRYGIRILEKDDGGVDFEMADGTPHYDRTELDYTFRARGDFELLNHGGYFLYAANAPDRVREITGLGRFGRLSRDVVDLEAQRPVVSEGVRIRDYPYNPFATSDRAMDVPVRLAYYAKTGAHFPLEPVQDAVIQLCDGSRTVGEILRALASRWKDTEESVRTLVDRGLLSLPGARYSKSPQALSV